MASFDKQEPACNSMHASMYASYVGAHLDMKRTVHAVFARCLEKQRVILTHHIRCRARHAPLEAVGVDKIAPNLLAHFCGAHGQLSLARHLISHRRTIVSVALPTGSVLPCLVTHRIYDYPQKNFF